MKEDTKIKDIFDGKLITIWKDDEMVYISFPWCTINIPEDEYDNLLKDFKNLVKSSL